MRKILRGSALVYVQTTRMETSAESYHRIWDLDMVKQVLNNPYSNVYLRQTALFTNHLTEGLKPVLGDYPQVQLKPELHQDDETGVGVDENVHGWMDANIFEETGIGRVTRRVYTKIVDLMTEEQGTYEDLYNAFSRSIQD